MADVLKLIYQTAAKIEALTPGDAAWIDRAFYYPEGVGETWHYQVLDGVMKKYSGDSTLAGVGCKINDEVIGGVKNWIRDTDTLDIPEDYEYNVHSLQVDGVVNCEGTINIM